MAADRRPTRTTSWGWIAGWGWIAAIWSAGALFDATQTTFMMRSEGGHAQQSCLLMFLVEFASWLPWALATPFVIRAARRYFVSRGMRVRAIGTHLAIFAVVSACAAAWSSILQVVFNPWGHAKQPTFVDTWTMTLVYQSLTYLIAYALIVSVALVLDARESMARQITETARLNEELSRAQLAALRGQIEPHFMYNALNSIAGLVRDHLNDAAINMIVGLSEFLRRSTEDSHRSQVALQEEVEYLQRYLEIQKARFGERLHVSVDIPPELQRAQVPNLLLQPLVENAIKHGISKRIAGGAVRVAGVRRDSSLCLSIYNDGPGLPTDWEAKQTGVGIRNLRTRLRILHGDDSELQLRHASPGGVEVLVTLPFREA